MATVYAGEALPTFRPEDGPAELARKLNQLAVTVDGRLARLEKPLVDPREPASGQEVYAVTNVTEDRTFDADATSTAELADVLGTLLTDLFNEGKLR